MRERIVAVFSVVVPDARASNPSIRHGFDEQEDVGLIHGAPAEREGLHDPIDCPLISAEHVAGKRLGERLDLGEQLSEIGVSEDRQKRAEDFVLHHFVGPGNRVEDGRIEITGRSVGLPTVNDLLWIDQRRESFDCGGADDAGIVRVALGVRAVEFNDSLLTFGYELIRDGFMNDRIAR